SGVGEVGCHGGAPAAQQIETGVIVLDQLKSPGSHTADVLADGFERLRQARVKGGAVRARARTKASGGGNFGGGVEGPQPDAGPYALALHGSGERGHIGEAGVTALPGTG